MKLFDVGVWFDDLLWQKRFYNREIIPFIRITQLAGSPSTLSWLAEILELRKGLISLVANREDGYERNLLHFLN